MKYNNLIKCIMNNYERLEGMVAATFTPMDENGDVNLSVIENMLIGSHQLLLKGCLCVVRPVNSLR